MPICIDTGKKPDIQQQQIVHTVPEWNFVLKQFTLEMLAYGRQPLLSPSVRLESSPTAAAKLRLRLEEALA